MQIIFFSSNLDAIDEFKNRQKIDDLISFYDLNSLNDIVDNIKSFILIVDYDSVAQEFNKLISSNKLSNNVIVLESIPEIATGKMLISHGVKAYGNIRMHTIHFKQMKNSVIEGKIWTYPELTAALIKESKKPTISADSTKLIENRLSQKEKEIVYLVLDGLTNSAIATKLKITLRTVKAHVSSIFSKLHINDRISLVLLLR